VTSERFALVGNVGLAATNNARDSATGVYLYLTSVWFAHVYYNGYSGALRADDIYGVHPSFKMSSCKIIFIPSAYFASVNAYGNANFTDANSTRGVHFIS
jgi:hypothetical protein